VRRFDLPKEEIGPILAFSNQNIAEVGACSQESKKQRKVLFRNSLQGFQAASLDKPKEVSGGERRRRASLDQSLYFVSLRKR
jgi:hypothetical protein